MPCSHTVKAPAAAAAAAAAAIDSHGRAVRLFCHLRRRLRVRRRRSRSASTAAAASTAFGLRGRRAPRQLVAARLDPLQLAVDVVGKGGEVAVQLAEGVQGEKREGG
jgi:hypothetical protein